PSRPEILCPKSRCAIPTANTAAKFSPNPTAQRCRRIRARRFAATLRARRKSWCAKWKKSGLSCRRAGSSSLHNFNRIEAIQTKQNRSQTGHADDDRRRQRVEKRHLVDVGENQSVRLHIEVIEQTESQCAQKQAGQPTGDDENAAFDNHALHQL